VQASLYVPVSHHSSPFPVPYPSTSGGSKWNEIVAVTGRPPALAPALALPVALPLLLSLGLCHPLASPSLTPTLNPCLFALGCWSVIPMAKVVETLLQVKQRQTRELKARTQARCVELLRGSHQKSSLHHNTSEPVSICLCCICRTAQARTQARCAELLRGNHQESSLHHNTPESLTSITH
jgi:hypothetical protein